MTTTMKLDITEEQYEELQEHCASVSISVDDLVTCLYKTILSRKQEIVGRFNGGEQAEQIMFNVAADVVAELFGNRNG